MERTQRAFVRDIGVGLVVDLVVLVLAYLWKVVVR